MRTPTLAVAALAATLVLPAAQAVARPSRTQPPSMASADHGTGRAAKVKPRSHAFEAKVIKITNARRAAHHRKPLKASRCADKFAESWTRHMARTGDFSHQSLTPFFNCPHTSAVGENIAFGYETPRSVVRGWMHSRGHRKNILRRSFNRIGVAAYRDANGRTYTTQDFLG